jgi:protein phosphatase-4 regulatory subunit 3
MSSSSSGENNAAASSSNEENPFENKVTDGFHMQIHVQQPKPHRKRKRDLESMSLSSGSSSSSSDDEEDNTKQQRHPRTKLNRPQGKVQDRENKEEGSEQPTTSSDDVSRLSIKGPAHSQHQNQPQPNGWRVKLYRLNADGSWDDCGTGRIQCLYKQQPKADVSSNSSSSNVSGDAWIYQDLGEPTLCMHSEVNTATGTTTPRILLRTRILLRDAYQRQGENIVTWCEPYLEEGNPTQGVDLALSFQDNGGCLDIWRQITQVQSKAADLFRRTGGDRTTNNVVSALNSQHDTNNDNNTEHRGEKSDSTVADQSSVTDVAHAVAAAHHATLQRQEQQEMWVNVASEHLEHQNILIDRNDQQHNHFEESAYHESNSTNNPQSPQLPNPPRLANLEEIADTIAGVPVCCTKLYSHMKKWFVLSNSSFLSTLFKHIQQRESLAMFISQNECSYLKSLLSLFPSAESRGDYGSLAALAACVKTILLLNDPSIIELIVSDELIFEEVCSTLEYDPDLRDKANHRWFLRERAKFRSVVLMEDEELIAAIHRSFRVNYLRDTLLRPTMDESSLSTLSSLQTFTHADVVKGVTISPAETDDKGDLLKDSYLAKVIRVLGRELLAICDMEWEEMETLSSVNDLRSLLPQHSEDFPVDPSTFVASGKYPQSQKMATIWRQHLVPQDNSLRSRRVRRRGSLSFLRELFNMVRLSLQQSDKDDFFAVLVSMEVDLSYGETESLDDIPHHASEQLEHKEYQMVEGSNEDMKENTKESTENEGMTKPVNLLSLLSTILSDPNTDVTEKGSVLEIIAGIAMHDPSLIRRRCLDFYVAWKEEKHGPARPNPNEKKDIVFQCPPNDLLASLLFLLAVETDAGVLLQVSEIMRIILDTDMMGDHGPMGAGFADEAEGIPPSSGHNPPHEQHNHPFVSLTSTTDQNQFLSMFYDYYIQWLAAPFQYKIFHPVRRVPSGVLSTHSDSPLMKATMKRFENGDSQADSMLNMISFCAIRSSFAVELLSFCVRAHLYRMKCYLLRSGVLGNVLKLLKPSTSARITSGDRCLKLAVLR